MEGNTRTSGEGSCHAWARTLMLIALARPNVSVKFRTNLLEELIQASVGGPHPGVVRIHRHGGEGWRLPRAKRGCGMKRK